MNPPALQEHTRMGPEPEKAEHPEILYFKFRILSRKFEIEIRGVDG